MARFPSNRTLLCATLAVVEGSAVFAVHAAPAPPPPPKTLLKGIVLWVDQARDHPELRNAVSLEFAYLTPASVVRGANADGTIRYDWSPLESLLDDIASRGDQAILRFRYEYPGEKDEDGVKGATGVPRHVKALPGYRETFSPNPGGDGPTWYADWSHPGLQDFTLRFYADFAERYDRDPRLAFFEVGFGHWSEYHISGTPVQMGLNFPSLEFQARLMRLLDERMRETPWCVSIDAAQRKYANLAHDPTLSALGFGLFDDSFMHKTHDLDQGGGYNERGWRAFGTNRWHRAPCGGEISYYSPRDQRQFLDSKGLYGVTWEQAAAKYHMTFIIANDSLGGQFATPERLAEAAAHCGYAFRLVRAAKESDALVVEIANDGVAPVYHDVRPSLDGVMADVSLRGLEPGATRTFRIATPAPPDTNAAARLRLLSSKLLPGAELPLARSP